jgi:hypothetical protein
MPAHQGLEAVQFARDEHRAGGEDEHPERWLPAIVGRHQLNYQHQRHHVGIGISAAAVFWSVAAQPVGRAGHGFTKVFVPIGALSVNPTFIRNSRDRWGCSRAGWQWPIK